MRALILLIALLTFVAPACAEDNVAAAQAVVRAQEQAMLKDDDATAYSFAGPPVTSLYRDADTFMTMVRSGYPQVNRHKSFEFGEAKASGDMVVQDVHIIDNDGVAWVAQYTLQQQTDGSMKINSCVLLKSASV